MSGKATPIGDMRERVEIQSATVTRGEFNEELLAWATTATVWAKVTERGGREPIVADRPVMVVSYEVVIRNTATVTHMNRLVWRSKYLSIDTVTPMPAQGLTVLRCLEATN
mgnify:CR=1 FL=1